MEQWWRVDGGAAREDPGRPHGCQSALQSPCPGARQRLPSRAAPARLDYMLTGRTASHLSRPCPQATPQRSRLTVLALPFKPAVLQL